MSDKSHTAVVPTIIPLREEYLGDATSAHSAPLPQLASERLQQETLFDVMESYIRYYATGDGHTARAKRYDLNYFLGFIAGGKELPSVPVHDWTLQATKDFVDDRLAQGEAPTTVGRRLATIKHFGRTLAERVPGFINPAREVKSPVVQPTRPHALTAEEIALLRQVAFEECERHKFSFNSCRNRFLLEVLLATGLRADEVRVLTLGQISQTCDWLKNVKTKGRKFRNVYLEEAVRGLVQEYLAQRRDYLGQHCEPISELNANEQQRFPVLISLRSASIETPASFGLAPKSIWRIIANFGKRAGALSPQGSVGSLHPHALRHTFAHGLLDSSRDVRLVAQALGHSDVRTTMRYTERTDEQLAEAIEEKARENKAEGEVK